MRTHDEIKATIAGQMSLIREAAEMLRQGTLPDISVMEQQTTDICIAMHKLEAAESQKLEGPVADLIGALEDLIHMLYMYQQNLPGQNEEAP